MAEVKSWDLCPRQSSALADSAALVAAGSLTWQQVADIVNQHAEAEGQERTKTACRMRWRWLETHKPVDDTDEMARQLRAQEAELAGERAIWAEQRGIVLRERARLEKEIIRLKALNRVVIEAIEERLVRLPTFDVRPWKGATHGTPQSANLVLGDAHGGEIVRSEDVASLNSYNWEELCRRAEHLHDSSLSILEGERRAWNIPVLNLLVCGDIVTGEDIFKGQGRDIDRILLDQALDMSELLVQQLIVPYLNYFSTVRMYGTWGNHGRMGRRGTHHKRSNADMIAYHFIRLRLEQVERFRCYLSQSPIIGWQTPEAPNFNFLMHHGHTVHRWMNIPYYGLERWTRRMMSATGVFWHYVIVGHHHAHAEIDASHGEMIINGSWVGPTDYALDQLQDAAPGKQLLFGLHPEHGITWRYPIWMSPRPKMTADENGLFTPVYQPGQSYSLRG